MARLLEIDSRDWSGAEQAQIVTHDRDFFRFASEMLDRGRRFDIVVTNPPYQQLNSSSAEWKFLRSLGIKVSNAYAAFLWLCTDLLADDGTLIALVPRSFFNGKQFEALRRHIFNRTSLTRVHTFESRSAVFKRDDVLQETVIVEIRKSIHSPPTIRLSSSSGPDVSDDQGRLLPTDQVLWPNEYGRVIAVPTQTDPPDRSSWPLLPKAFPTLSIATGSVVDFRFPHAIRPHGQATDGFVPLIDANFGHLRIRDSSRRPPREITVSDETQRHIFPPGNYVVLRRFSPKEQRPRLRLQVIRESDCSTEGVAFENHVNVLHSMKRGLTDETLEGLLPFLQSEDANLQFQAISGSTQVNVSDLKLLRVPPRDGNI